MLEHYQPFLIKENEGRWSNCDNTSHRFRLAINNMPFVGRPIFPWSRVISAVEDTTVTVEWFKEPCK